MKIDSLRRDTIDKIIAVEGGYSNHPSDAGGETMFGVTAAVARAHGYTGPMRDMPRSVAEAVYRRSYWDALRLDDIAAQSIAVAAELADTAVNMGPGTAAGFLQRALNCFNRQGRFYADLAVDGRIGPATLGALERYLFNRRDDGETVLLRAMNALQGARYIELCERRQTDEEFVFGWLLHRVVMEG
ncbi:MAG: hypothetical protein RLY86_131 [Pseudomonadota bacterium]|jgi:lysozyme family protein